MADDVSIIIADVLPPPTAGATPPQFPAAALKVRQGGALVFRGVAQRCGHVGMLPKFHAQFHAHVGLVSWCCCPATTNSQCNIATVPSSSVEGAGADGGGGREGEGREALGEEWRHSCLPGSWHNRVHLCVCRHGEYMGTCKLTNTVLLDRQAKMT
jgi:hypothetical protein